MAYVEPALWYERIPNFNAAAGAVFTDDRDRILLVKPNYRPYWSLPGGIVEAGETPDLTCEREIKEELGLRVRAARLLVVDWVPPAGERPRAFVYFLFACTGFDHREPISPQVEELDGYGFFDLPEASRRVDASAAARVRAGHAAARSGGTIYLPLAVQA